VLLNRDYALKLVIGPAFGCFVGVSIYHVIVFFAGHVWKSETPVPETKNVEADLALHPASVESYGMQWARNMAYGSGIVGGLLVTLHMFGASFTKADGSMGFLPTAAIVILFAYGIWTYSRQAIDHRIAIEKSSAAGEGSGEGEGGGIGQSRLATLLPLFRNAVMVTIVFLVCLILLAKAGVDITPVFASAGIVGLAIGFGAQSLVRDIISGLFFLLDDAFRLGEYIETGGVKGTVERISVRSMQLRHHNGPLNTIPFGEISEVTNFSRDWVIMKLPIKVALDTDPEKVRKMVKKLGQELLEDPVVGDKFLDPLKSQGVLSIDNWGMTIRVKFKTLPGDQFIVRRHVFARLHDLFEEEGIQFASRDVKIKVESPNANPDGSTGATAKAATGAAVTASTAMAVGATMADDDAGPPDDGDDNDAR
jgi:small-conductance mechanosensitive channel